MNKNIRALATVALVLTLFTASAQFTGEAVVVILRTA